MKRRSSTHQDVTTPLSPIHHPRFAAWYERCACTSSEGRFMDPLRKEIIDQASGLVLEIGAGTGLNFAFYQPGRVERVEAVEPDDAMLRYARERLSTARVPVELTQAPAEALPFADETFDSAVTTLVFCSVADPLRGLHEIRRVLKPGGLLLMVEHVQAQGAIAARVQDALVPLTTRFAGNCHWNRNTASTVISAGFQMQDLRKAGGVLIPIIVLSAIRP
ncbi:MAG TPA: class I SAM-dependent methyltransferase [Ktedonobacteraceae bacterium]|nr:class I SAM-dependent methyltransferase [Ktedonobacteraceae bacterium]